MKNSGYTSINIVLVLFVVISFAAYYGLWKHQYEVMYKYRNLDGEKEGTVDFIAMRRGYEPGDTIHLKARPVVIIEVINNEEVRKNK